MNIRASRWIVLCCLLAQGIAGEAQAVEPDFEKEIAPLLIRRCVLCHQGRDASGSLLLTTEAGMLAGGDSGPAVDRESPAESFLLQRISNGEMPPPQQGKPQNLPQHELRLLTSWVAAGAPWPDGRTLDLFERTNELRAGRDWWSLQPIERPEVPRLNSPVQPAHPIDAFIGAKLQQHGMVPAPPADKRTLLLRVYDDLIGIPPTAAEIEAFIADDSPDAWENVIDTLLASPLYGQRWGRYWLDVVRYADTSGYERDQEKPFAWKYRDWVIDAFNSDMPYEQFIIEQLAGDELPDRNVRTVIATGMLRLGTWNDEPNEPLDYQYDRLEDLVHTTSSAFLGMTIKCARCHAHKFDPIMQEDYYRLASAFWAGPIAARERELLGGPSAEELGFDEVLGWTDLTSSPAPLHMLRYGERAHPLGAISPASLSFLPELERTFDPPPEGARTSHRRLQLARWIADGRNPLTPRVLVNRLWLHHFGQGIVRTPNNFGFLADPPTHPQLLDWLAAEFQAGGGTIKRMHKLILTSATWQQSSLHPQATRYQDQDATNRLWWHAERRRLDAESLRDAMLSVTGELDLRAGGPGFVPTLSEEALEGLSRKSAAWNASPPQEQLRRSVYMYAKRGLLSPMMTTFDFADATQPCGQRDVTIVPTQALALLNNQFVHERSEALAVRIASQSDRPDEQIHLAWLHVLRRAPSADERRLAVDHLAAQLQEFKQQQEHQQEQEQLQQQLPAESPGAKRENQRSTSDELSALLVLHLRADRGVVADAEGNVSQWQDQSSAQHHARQTIARAQPQLVQDGIGGQSAIAFDGQTHFLHLDGTLLDDQQCTIIAVIDDRGSTGHRTLLSNWNGVAGNSVTSLFVGLTGKATVRFSDDVADGGQIDDGARPFILTALSGFDRVAVLQNGRVLHSRSRPLTPRDLTTEWVVGQQGNIQGEYWHGRVAEIRVYRGALEDEQRAIVERQLAQFYGIPMAEPARRPRPTPQVLALASLCHVLLNSNEFIYRD